MTSYYWNPIGICHHSDSTLYRTQRRLSILHSCNSARNCCTSYATMLPHEEQFFSAHRRNLMRGSRMENMGILRFSINLVRGKRNPIWNVPDPGDHVSILSAKIHGSRTDCIVNDRFGCPWHIETGRKRIGRAAHTSGCNKMFSSLDEGAFETGFIKNIVLTDHYNRTESKELKKPHACCFCSDLAAIYTRNGTLLNNALHRLTFSLFSSP